MALYPVRPLYSASSTATNGSDIITVTGNVNCAFIASGAIVSLGTRQLVDAIAGTAPDGSGNSTIKLRRPWADPTTTGPLLAFMSWEGLADAVARLSQIIAASEGAVEGAFSNMGDWSAASGDFPPSPGEGLGSQMYRVSVAGTMGGRAYRVGEVIYYDQFSSQWRSMLGLATAFSTGLLASANAAAWRDELGLVPTTSATDTTPGRILQVGAGHQQLDSSLYRRGNILGTVSQSGGIPTGAIIQRGSNANGSFVMFADGTAMYWGSRNVTGVSINAAKFPNTVTSFDCLDPNVLFLSGKTYVVTGASAFDSFGLPVYTVRMQNSSGGAYLSLGTRPSDQWPYLDSFGPHVITSYAYEFFCIGRWF